VKLKTQEASMGYFKNKQIEQQTKHLDNEAKSTDYELSDYEQMEQDYAEMEQAILDKQQSAMCELSLAIIEIKSALEVNPSQELRTALTRVKVVYESMWNRSLYSSL